jgi:hypothetical protein
MRYSVPPELGDIPKGPVQARHLKTKMMFPPSLAPFTKKVPLTDYREVLNGIVSQSYHPDAHFVPFSLVQCEVRHAAPSPTANSQK